MKEENLILGTTRKVADLSEENLASVSGSGSVPCIEFRCPTLSSMASSRWSYGTKERII
jgi:hypothetical protein